MAAYVLYCMDGCELIRADRFAAGDHDAAIAEARQRAGRYKAELWCGPRKVTVLERQAAA